MNLWSLPSMEDKGENEISLELCSPVPDRMLTGVAFLTGSTEGVLATTYDTHSMPYWVTE